jgi:high-affinity K+ transport system ATPase subunit B
MSASPREFTTTDDGTINSMSIAQLEVALALNYDVFKAKEASAVGDAV